MTTLLVQKDTLIMVSGTLLNPTSMKEAEAGELVI